MDKTMSEKEILHLIFQKALITGFCGGLIWSIVWLILYSFNMVKINPTLFWDRLFWERISFHHWYMYLAVIILYGILSVLIAIIYYFLFKKISHWFMGVVFGLSIWAVFLFVIPYVFYNVSLINVYASGTFIGMACLCIVYGLFIGYTISFDYEKIHLQYSGSK